MTDEIIEPSEDEGVIEEVPADEVRPAQPAADAEPSPADTAVEADEEAPKGVYLTPRGILTTVAIVLMLILIALLVYLLLLNRNTMSARVDASAVEGIKAEVIVRGPGKGKVPTFKRPMGAAWSPNGREIYVADTSNNRICVFHSDGRFINEFGGFGIAKPLKGAKMTWNPGELNYPTDVATDSEGRVYVADFYNDSISVFTANGEFLRRFPDPYKPVGKGSSGHEGNGIAVTAVDVEGDKVYATDTYQVFVFDLQGKLLTQFGKPGLTLGDLDHPNGIVADDKGRIMVSDSNNNRVVAFSADGRPLWTAGKRLAAGTREVQDTDFVLPRGLTIMKNGNLLVADPLGQRLVSVTPEGQVLERYGARGVQPSELNFPNDVDWYGSRMIIADRENNRVQIARLVAK